MCARSGAGRGERLARLRRDEAFLAERYPELKVEVDVKQATAVARGPIVLVLPDGTREPVEVRIVFGPSYPQDPPVAYDAASRWRPALERHIVEDGQFCLYFDPVDAPDLRPDRALAAWTADLVVFVHQQFIFDAIRGRRWPGPEWPHGSRAAYATHLVEQLGHIAPGAREAVWDAVRTSAVTRNDPCPCGSGHKLKRCHHNLAAELKRAGQRSGLCSLTYPSWARQRVRDKRARPEAGPEDDRGVEFGWKAHAAIQDWTRTVDQKASITLVFTTALGGLAAREVLSAQGGLHNPAGAQLWAVRGMGLLFAAAALLALAVVFPRLRRRKVKAEAHAGLVYFGHLRYRSREDVRAALAHLNAGEVRDQLARQLVYTGRIAWSKHVLLRWALSALVGAIALFGVARLLL